MATRLPHRCGKMIPVSENEMCFECWYNSKIKIPLLSYILRWNMFPLQKCRATCHPLLARYNSCHVLSLWFAFLLQA